jgi:hypothetical protein
MRQWGPLLVAGLTVEVELKVCASREFDATFGEGAEAEFGPLQVR